MAAAAGGDTEATGLYGGTVSDEAEDDERLRTKMRDILVATANALKGDPGPLKQHSWHDLAEVAGRQRELLAKREAQLAEAIARLQENYRGD